MMRSALQPAMRSALAMAVNRLVSAAAGPTLGDELNTSPASWTVQAGWTNNGDGSYSGTSDSGFYRTVAGTDSGVNLEVSLTISNYTAGTVVVSLRGTTHTVGSGNGVKTFRLLAGPSGDGNFYIYGSGGLSCTISAISVKQVL
ncbi:hypothetical protein WG922_21540 [Ramlibacter sp. AN1015]|uniref:hypothetical protein n=1 Tax=Ramlibacter sp. AN1015 TaxID=3133428 RepID=UPI0030BC85CC